MIESVMSCEVAIPIFRKILKKTNVKREIKTTNRTKRPDSLFIFVLVIRFTIRREKPERTIMHPAPKTNKKSPRAEGS
jgi:hypothetical protein